MDVNNLLEGSAPYQVLSEQSAKLAGKWEKSGLLEGIENSTERSNMSMLLENQAKQLVNEANSTTSAGSGASFSGGNSEAWAGVALPLVRRVFGEIVAKDLVSVQPMNLPAGLIFYLDFQYGTDTDGFSSGDSIYAASGDMTKTTLPGVGQTKGLYGAGTFGYSSQLTSSIMLTSSATPSLKSVGSGSTFTGYDADLLGGFAHGVMFSTSSFLGNNNSNPDLDAVRAFRLSSGSVTNYGQYNFVSTSGHIVLFVDDLAAGAGNQTVEYYTTPDNLNDRGDFEDTLANTGTSALVIPEINVQMRSDMVAAKTRKLKAQWTPEFAQDLNAYHSIDAEAELTSMLSEYISMEIDLEILDMLIRNADTTAYWSAEVGKDTNAQGAKSNAASSYYTRMSWFQTLGVKLQSVSNTIHQKTLRGGANWMVVSPKVSTILESIPGFAADSAGDSDKYGMGVQKMGAINNRYTVYKNPYTTENVILMGYKGSQFLETGAVFAPYIPLIMTPLVYDPVSFTPKKGIMTRYAKKMVRPDFYGKVVIRDLNLI
jgi:hypothetical protein